MLLLFLISGPYINNTVNTGLRVKGQFSQTQIKDIQEFLKASDSPSRECPVENICSYQNFWKRRCNVSVTSVNSECETPNLKSQKDCHITRYLISNSQTTKLHGQARYRLLYLLNDNKYLVVKSRVIHSDKHSINSQEKPQQQEKARRHYSL